MPKAFVILFCTLLLSCQSQPTTKIINVKGKTIEERFNPPDGYKRKNYSTGCFEYYLKSLPLKPAGEKVHTYDGSIKQPDNVYDAVLDIDIGSKDHVYVDMAFKCGAEVRTNCDTLLTEFKEVNLFIRKVYQKQYIVSAEGTPAWDGVDSLE